MYEHKTIIDSNGYVIEKCVLFKDGEAQFYRIADNAKAVVYCNKNFVKPHWTGTEWEETATKEEINNYYDNFEKYS